MTDKMMAEESFPSSQGKRNLRSRMTSTDTLVLTSSKGRRNSTRLQKAVNHIEEAAVPSFTPEITSDANLPRTPLRRTTRRTSMLDENQDSNFSPAKTPLRNTRVTSIADENLQSKTPVRRSRRLSTDTHDVENMTGKAGRLRVRPISPKEEIVLEEREEQHEGSNNDSRKDVRKISVNANKYEKLLNRFENPKTPLGDQVNDLSNDSTSEIKDQKEKKGEQHEENVIDSRAAIKKSVVNIQRFETLLNRPENTKANLGDQASDDSTESKSETKIDGEETTRNIEDELSQNDVMTSEEGRAIQEEPEATLEKNAEDCVHEKAKPDGQKETEKLEVNKSLRTEENEIPDTTQKLEDEGSKDTSVNKEKDDPLQGISLVAFAPSMHSSNKKSPIRFPKTPGVSKNVTTPEGADDKKNKNSSSGKKAKNISTSHHENEVSLSQSCKKSINFDSSQDEDHMLTSTLEAEKTMEEANKSGLKSGNTSQNEQGLKTATENVAQNKSSKSSKNKAKRSSRDTNESVQEIIHIDLDDDDYDGVRPHRRKAKKVTSYCEDDFEIEPMVDLTATGEVVDLTDDDFVDLTDDTQQSKKDEKTDIVICDDSEEVHSQHDADAEMNFFAMVPEVVIEEIAFDTTGKVEVSQKTLKSLVDGSSIVISNGLEIVKMPTQEVTNQAQNVDEPEKSQVESMEIDEDETDEANASKVQTLNKQPDCSEESGALENDSAGSNPNPVDPVTVYECQVKVSDNSKKTVDYEEGSVAGGVDGMEKTQEKERDEGRQEGESKILQNALETSESFKDCVEEDSSGVFESVNSPEKTNNDDQTLGEVSENLEADDEGTSQIMTGDSTVVADNIDEVSQLNATTPVSSNGASKPDEGDKEIPKDVDKCAMDESNIGNESPTRNSILTGGSPVQSPQKLDEAQKKSSMDDEKDFENLEESIKPSEPTKNDSMQGENCETLEKNLDARIKELVRIIVEDVEGQNTSRDTAEKLKLDSSISATVEPVSDKSMSIVEDSVMLSKPLQDDSASVSMSVVEDITEKPHPPTDEMTNVSMSVDGDNTDSEGSAIMEVTSKNLESHQPSNDEKSTDMSLQIEARKNKLNKTVDVDESEETSPLVSADEKNLESEASENMEITSKNLEANEDFHLSSQCLVEGTTEKSAPLTDDMMNVSALRDGDNTNSAGSATMEVNSKKLEIHQPLDMEVEKDSLTAAKNIDADKNSETEASGNMEITSKNLEAQGDERDLHPANGERFVDEKPSLQENLSETESDANQPTSANINSTSVQDIKIEASENEEVQHPVGSQHDASKSKSPEPDTQDEAKKSNQSITSNCQELDSDFISAEDHELIEQIEAEARRRQMSQNLLESKEFALEEKSPLPTEISPKDSNREVEGNDKSVSQEIKDPAENLNKLKQKQNFDDSLKDTTVETPQEHELHQKVETFSQPKSLNSVGVDEVPLSYQIEDLGSEDTDASSCNDEDEGEEGEFDSFIVSDTENDELVIDENTSNYNEIPEKSDKNGDRLEVSSDEEFEHLIVEPSESSNENLVENLASKEIQQQRFCNNLAIPETRENLEIDTSSIDPVQQNKITLVEGNPHTATKSDKSLIDPISQSNIAMVEENPKEIDQSVIALIVPEALKNKLPVPETLEGPKENDNSSTSFINSVEQNNVTLVEEDTKATNESKTSSSNPVEQNANTTLKQNQAKTDRSSPSLIDPEALNNELSVPETRDNTKATEKCDASFIDTVEHNITPVVEDDPKATEKTSISLIDSAEQSAITEIEENPEDCKLYNIITVVKEESEFHSENGFIENHYRQSTSKNIEEVEVISNDECMDIKKEQDDGGIDENDTENLNDQSVNPGTAETADELPNTLSVPFEPPLDSKFEGLEKCTEEKSEHDKTLANNENCNKKQDANQRREESQIDQANGSLNNSQEDDSCTEELLKINWQQQFEYSSSEGLSYSIQKRVIDHNNKDILSTESNTKEIDTQGTSSKGSPKVLCSIDFALVNKSNEENEKENENIINAETNGKTIVMEPESSETRGQKDDSANERVTCNEKCSGNDLAKHSETSIDNAEQNFEITGGEAPKPKRKRQKDNLMDKEDIKKMKLTNDQNANVISVPLSTPITENTNSTRVNKSKKKNTVQHKTLKDVTAEMNANAEEMKLDETENRSKQDNESKTAEKLIETDYHEQGFGRETSKKKYKTKSDVYATDEYPITIVDTTIKKMKTDETQNYGEINKIKPHVKKTSAKTGEKKLNTQANVVYDIDEYPITIVDTTIKRIKTDAKEALVKNNNYKYDEINKTRPHVKEASAKPGEKELKTKANVEYESDEYPITVVYKANEKIKADKTKNSHKINDSKNVPTNLKTASHIDERKKSRKKSPRKSHIVYEVDEYPITLVDTNEESQEEIVLKKSKLAKKQKNKIQNKKRCTYENEFIENSFVGTTSPKLKEYKKTAKLGKKNAIKKRRLDTNEITNVPLHFAATKENSTMSQKKPKVSKIVSSSGVFNEEPVTPKRTKKTFGFIETYKSPMAVGFRINDINKSNNGNEKALALQSVTRRLYRNDDLTPADTEYTTAGEFTVFKLPKPARKLKERISLTGSNVVVKRRQEADIALYIDRAAKVRKVEIL